MTTNATLPMSPPQSATMSTLDFKAPDAESDGEIRMQPEFLEGLHYTELGAFTLICAAIQPDTSMPLDQAATELLRMMDTGRNEDYTCWNHDTTGKLLFFIAGQIPYNHSAHEKLASLTDRMQKQTWDAQNFNQDLGGYLHLCFPVTPDMTLEALASEVSRFLNINAFFTQLCGHGSNSLDWLPIEYFRDTFEDDPYDPNNPNVHFGGYGRGSSYQTASDEVQTKMRNFAGSAAIRLSCLWMTHHAAYVFRHIVKEEDISIEFVYTGPMNVSTGKKCWQGEVRGRWRWEFWKQALRDIIDDENLERSLRTEAGDAVEAMNNVDGGEVHETSKEILPHDVSVRKIIW